MTNVIRVTQDEWDSIIAEAEKQKADRAKEMPTVKDAIDVMHRACQRLIELGFKDAIYCPKDGTIFDAIEAGSTGVHACSYLGEWPTGSWFAHEGGDLWPVRPILFRLKQNPELLEGE